MAQTDLDKSKSAPSDPSSAPDYFGTGFQLICRKCRLPTTLQDSVKAGSNEMLRNCLPCVAYDRALNRRSFPKAKVLHGEQMINDEQQSDKKEALLLT